ncbi:hypothetical protein C923_02025 [Plasmodium falciparum UGT5.1]|uniref:Erythrocyte membrane protein 1, PfEMP1 n=1 Tax=Plasmodium falciparum UGT5.1 TaxID=1237627 RepID=W7JEF2_PLAFA|nr:hypothetical protein C923_02025 [Plasmodium falciparum UGT5.1]
MEPAQHGRGGNDYSSAKNAKELLDQIGEKIQQQAHEAAKQYYDYLHGDLSQATFRANDGSIKVPAPPDACQLHHTVHTNVTSGRGREYPCANRSEVRFSDTQGAECDNRKIRDNDKKTGGACAPYRRLHICDYNLENINDYNNINNHTLLVDVCLAAKHEGESLKGYHGKHQLTYLGYHSQLCTELARSFADIGDIIRGKDLYRRDKKKDKLQDNLKKIFGIIYDEVTRGKTNEKKEEIERRYGQDGQNFYQLREDWWALNRDQVWKALICHAPTDAEYFRKTACGGGKGTQGRCRCVIGDVPTYFDYVPQFLRWFEEWAEDFCRKRKKQLEKAKKFCRGDEGMGEVKYCDLNGYDCKRTAKGEKRFVQGDDCYNCSVTCNPFGPWIDNQKQEFEKQRNKYQNEISSNSRRKRSIGSDTYKGYDEQFYKIFRGTYGDVDTFLELLCNETACQSQPYDEGRLISINFKKNEKYDIFSHTEYCQACPWCGMDCPSNGTCTKKEDSTCQQQMSEKEYDSKNKTDIPILTPDKSQKNILQKYKNFCKNGEKSVIDGGQIKKWQCYYDENKENGEEKNNCIDGEWEKFAQDKTFRSYYYFFWIWVHDMLHDSVEWKRELSKCINNNTNGNRCRNGCNRDCKCYESWAQQKQTEWEKIVKHFYTQKGFDSEGHNNIHSSFNLHMTHDVVLELLLKEGNLLQNIKDVHGDTEDIKHIEALLDEEKKKNQVEAAGTDNQNKTTIDKLLKHEKGEANKCTSIHNDNTCSKKPPKPVSKPEDPARSAETVPSPQTPDDSSHDVADSEDEEDDDEDDLDAEAASEGESEEPVEDTEGTGDTTENTEQVEVEKVNPCQIVTNLFKDVTTLTNACSTKYGKDAPVSWKCIPSGKPSDTTGKSGTTSGGSGDNTGSSGEPTGGSICVPPRRRKLYIKKIVDWAESQSKTVTSVNGDGNGSQEVVSVNGASESGNQGSRSGSSSSSSSDSSQGKDAASTETTLSSLLRQAFIESAAVETFFLWHKFKEQWRLQKQEEQQRQRESEGLDFPFLGGSPQPLSPLPVSNSDEDPQKKLEKGVIPEEFKRQMFYTLGDYKDILDGKNIVVDLLSGSSGSDKEIAQREEKIKDTIQTFFQNGDSQPPSVNQTPSDKRKSWWDKNGQHIWNGMVCALTYDTNSGGAGTTIEKVNAANDGKDLFDTLKTQYQYDQVKLKEENSGGKKNNDTIQPPTLKQFTSRPPYFRYLEEWGETFCKERKKRLEKIEGECKVDENIGGHGNEKKPKCSCYGENCDDQLKDDPSNFPDLWCQDCGKYCRSYRKWIERKGKEFEKQKKAYNEQKNNYVNEHNDAKSKSGDIYDEYFVGKLSNVYTSIKLFLENLGSCKKDSGEGNGKDNKIFDEKGDTFQHAKHCKPCPEFKIKCENCKSSGGTQKKCNGKKGNDYITAKDIGNGGNSTEILDMLVSDNSGNGSQNDLKDCIKAGIFKGIREDKWKCRNVCGYVVCKQEKGNGKPNGENPIITIRGLVEHWVHNFLDDYKKIKHKISHCKENDEKNICKKDCQNKCKCVKNWIDQKKDEWKKIKERFLEQYKDERDEYFNLRSCLEDFESRPEFKNAIKPCDFDKFKGSCGLNGDASSKEGKKNEINDVIDCLIKKLENLRTKMTACQDQHQTAENPEIPCPTPPLVEDEEEIPEENPVDQQPGFCPKVQETKETVVEKETCDVVDPGGDGKPKGDQDSTPAEETEQTNVINPEKEAPRTPKVPTPHKPPRRKPPPQLLDDPLLKTALMSSTIMWSIGIGFAAFTYFFLKVNGSIYIWMFWMWIKK